VIAPWHKCFKTGNPLNETRKGTTAMTTTIKFFAAIDSKSKHMILENIANHYGISTVEAESEVTDSDAEHLLDYVTGTLRAATSVLMQRHGLR